RGVLESWQQRLDAGVVLRLAGRAQRPHRPAVETVKHADDLVPARGIVQPGELDRRFVRFRAAVAEEALAGEIRPPAESLAELALRLGVPRVRHMDQLCDLLLYGRDDSRRAVAEQAATPAGEEVEIAMTFGVPDVRTLAAD